MTRFYCDSGSDDHTDQITNVLGEEHPFDWVRSFAMGPILTYVRCSPSKTWTLTLCSSVPASGPYLEMLIEEEDSSPEKVAQHAQSDFLVDACWAHFYATGEDLPIKILLKIASPVYELTDPNRERKEKHVKRISQHALNSLRSQPSAHIALLPMYENLLKLDKSLLKNKARLMLLDQIVSEVRERLVTSTAGRSAEAEGRVSPHFQTFLKLAKLISSVPKSSK